MFEAFRGWRRKTGCATLAAAIVLMIGWIRSYVVMDILEVDLGPTAHVFRTSQGTVLYWTCLVPKLALGYTFNSVPNKGFVAYNTWPRGFEAAPMGDSIELTFPFWLLVSPTLVLSAYLLLRKPVLDRRTQVYADPDLE